MLLITHYQRLLNYITPDFRPRRDGWPDRRSGGPEVAAELEAQGYDVKDHVAVGDCLSLRRCTNRFAEGNRPEKWQLPIQQSENCDSNPPQEVEIADYQYGFHDEEDYFFKRKAGSTPSVVRKISK